MKRQYRIAGIPVSLVLCSLCLVVALAGCTPAPKGPTVRPSGFLGDYSLLQEGAEGQAALTYVNPQTDFAAYDKVMIDPVTIWWEKDADIPEPARKELQGLADHLFATLVKALQDDYEIVDKPGKGVLRLRFAITEARRTEVVTEMVSSGFSQMPGTLMSRGMTMNTRTRVFAGKAAIEGEIVDSRSGERLLAAVDERVGSATSRRGKEWGDVLDAYDYWANRLKTRLAELRAK